MKTILRKEHKRSYTNIDNELLDDKRLSLGAKGLACFLLRKPDNWGISIPALARENKEGEFAIRGLLQELAEVGYLMRVRKQGADGRFCTVTLVADYCAYAEVGTARTRIYGYDPDLSETDRSVTDPAETDRSVTARSIQTPSTTTEKKKALSPAANADKQEPKHRQPAPKPACDDKAVKDKGAHQQVVDAYVQTLEDYEPRANHNYSETGKWAKDIVARGFTADDVAYAVTTMKAEDFWSGRHLKLASVASQISAIIAKRAKTQAKKAKRQDVVMPWEK